MNSKTIARFEEKFILEPNSGCWIWIGAIGSHGYGNFYADGAYVLAHRFSYQLYVGPIPEGFEPDHLCRFKPCVNPRHLEAVPRWLNAARGESPTALNGRKTHCKAGHILAGSNLSLDRGKRRCRRCVNEAAVRSYYRHRETILAYKKAYAARNKEKSP